MSSIPHGTLALIETKGHRKSGRVGKVLDGPGEFLGTYTVKFEDGRYGFLPHELAVLSDQSKERAALNAVRDLHAKSTYRPRHCKHDGDTHPCATVRAIEEALR